MQKGGFLQPCFFILSAKREASLYFGHFSPFLSLCPAPELQQLIGPVFLSSRAALMYPTMDKSAMYQNSAVSSHLQNILHETRLSLLIPAPRRRAAVSHRCLLLQRPFRALRILPPAISNLCDRNSLALRKMRSH